MSLSTVDQVMFRIKGATPQSPIAVFRSGLPRKLNAVFADTIESARQIKNQHKLLIGVYHNEMNLESIEAKLRSEAI